MKKILIMGLSGAGKTSFTGYLSDFLSIENYKVGVINGDTVRFLYKDTNFSVDGRIKQAKRLKQLIDQHEECDYLLIDTIAPLPVCRDIINPDFIVFIDTIKKCQYKDTNEMFVPPLSFGLYIKTKISISYWASYIVEYKKI